MTLRVAINGFGRIGRLVARAVFEQKREDIEIVAITDPSGSFFPLLKYDSAHGRAPFSVESDGDDTIILDGKRIRRYRERDPSKINWRDEGVDIVMECTGKFKNREGGELHLNSGAKKVLFSVPAKEVDATIVYGVNHDTLKTQDKLVSNASCTTNCLAPVAKALYETVGLEKGFMTTIHAYTGTQRLIDGSHKDPLRARSAAVSMIPASTGAAKAVGLVLPELNGKLDGVSVRVPIANVSMIDLTFLPSKKITAEEVNDAVTSYANMHMKGILGVYDDPCVSIDFNHDPHSAMFSLEGTKVVDGDFVRVMAWYDNEWGYSCRMIDTALAMHNKGYT
ncbi:MAG: type I glyceraldehyde-3-phosphate dehydrogenase [Alphaproteobacteria bacterium]